MDRRQCSVETYALLQASTIGDEIGVRRALIAGADVNGTDASGRTALTNAITGWQMIHASDASFMSESRLNVLKILVSQRGISLFTLNAPRGCMNGVSPLGMCAWLNMPEAVQVLLDCSAGRMFVDGMDTLGATPLMYAARDGNVAVVQYLLDRGARPDFRDINHRTAIQHCLRQPETLWLCESSLREARRRDYETSKFRDIKLSPTTNNNTLTQRPLLPTIDVIPTFPLYLFTRHDTSSATNKLIHAIRSSDLTLLNSLVPSPLTSSVQSYQTPVLVNRADSNGWSPIHYCVATERPSTEILDTLYLAGADISLFTTSEQYTPLHCLAKRAHSSTHSLYLFAVHLIRDLQAPLGAKDRHEETCIHIAAEHGECIHVLMAFLDCDKSGVIRNMRNSRGLTALEVAKPRFRPAFEMGNCLNRPQSSTSARTIRPSPFKSSSPPGPSQEFSCDYTVPLPCQTGFNLTSTSQCFMDNLHFISSELSHHMQTMRLDRMQSVLLKASQASNDIFSHLRAQINEAYKELEDARMTFRRVDAFWRMVSHVVEARLPTKLRDDEGLLFELAVARKTSRDSGDSEATAVSDGSTPVTNNFKLASPKFEPPQEYASVSVAVNRDVPITPCPPRLNIVAPQAIITSVRTTRLPDWLIPRSSTASPKVPQSAASNTTDHGSAVQHAKLTVPAQERRPTSPRLDLLKSILTGQRKDIAPRDLDEENETKLEPDVVKSTGGCGSSRLKTWLKKIVPDYSSLYSESTFSTDEGCTLGKAERDGSPSQTEKKTEEAKCNAMIMRPALRDQLITLITASRDLGNIEECITAAEHFITTAYRSISRAERIALRALEARQKAIENLRVRFAQNSAPLQSILVTTIINPDSSDFSVYHDRVCSKSSGVMSSMSSSVRSSHVSLLSTLTDVDDEDMKALRALLLQKIEARLDVSFDEIDRVTMWLRIVKEVVRGVKNRAHL